MYNSKNAKQYIITSVGKYTSIDVLWKIAKQNDIKGLYGKEKSEMVSIIEDSIGYRKLSQICEVGVSTFEIQKEFSITNNEVRKLAQAGLIRPVKKIAIKGKDKPIQAYIYNVFDCFNLTQDKVELKLIKNNLNN